MQYDPDNNVYIDLETGDIIPVSEDDDLNNVNVHQVQSASGGTGSFGSKSDMSTTRDANPNRRGMEHEYTLANTTGEIELGMMDGFDGKENEEELSDHQYAAYLQHQEMNRMYTSGESHSSGYEQETSNHAGGYNNTRFGRVLAGPVGRPDTSGEKTKPVKPEKKSAIFREIAGMSRTLIKKKNKPAEELIPESAPGANDPEIQVHQEMDGTVDDWSLARALQMAEFEMENEVYQARGGDFIDKEVRGSSCLRQLKTISTLFCVLQIAVLILTVEDDGYAPSSTNPMIGPYPTTLVRWGAKDAALILLRNEWWRLFSPIMLHAGIIHLISNVFIQLRVGGYLNLVFGNKAWVLIYVLSGVYGNMCSCVFLPEAIGVGSSGALLGILAAWIVWIIFRWKKIPKNNRAQRNCQLVVVTAAVATTLAMSFSSLVDWAAHFGGAIQGILCGLILLSKELDNETTQKVVRYSALCVSLGLFVVTFVYMMTAVHPSDEFFPTFDANDDWNKYPHNGPNDPDS